MSWVYVTLGQEGFTLALLLDPWAHSPLQCARLQEDISIRIQAVWGVFLGLTLPSGLH